MSTLRADRIRSLDGTGEQGMVYPYTSGQVIESRADVIRIGDVEWQLAASTSVPYTTTGAGMPEGGAFVSVGDAGLRQDLAAPLGAASVGAEGDDDLQSAIDFRVRRVDSGADLASLTVPAGALVSLSRLKPGTDAGGGEFYWDASRSKTEHNGIDVIDPERPFPADFENAAQVESWLEAAPSGEGCFVRTGVQELNAAWAGLPVSDFDAAYALVSRIEEIVFDRKINAYFPAGVYDIGNRNWPFRTPGLAPTELRDYGGATIYGDGSSTVFKTTSAEGADVLQLNAVQSIQFKNLALTATLTGSDEAGSNGISITNGGRDIHCEVECYDLGYVDKTTYIDGGKAFTIQPASNPLPVENITARVVARNCAFGVEMSADSDVLIERPFKNIDIQIFCDTAYLGVVLSGTANTVSPASNGLHWGVRIRGTTINCQQHYFSARAWHADVDLHCVNTTNDLGGWTAGDTETFVSAQLASKGERAVIRGSVLSVDVLHRVGGTTQGGGVSGSSSDCDLLFNVDFQTATTQFQVVDSGGNSITRSTIRLPSHVTSVDYAALLGEQNILAHSAVLYAKDMNSYNTLTHRNNAGTKVFGVRPDGDLESPLTTTAALGSYVGKKAEYDAAGSFLGFRPIYS